MFGLEILDIGIGLIVIYLVLSLMCTAASELVAGFTNARARTLKKGIERLFEDTGFDNFKTSFFEHSLVRSLVESRKGPSYIPSKTFSTTMLDLLAKGSLGTARTWDDVTEGVNEILDTRRNADGTLDPDDPLVQTVRVLVDRAHGELGQLEAEIGAWFDSAMERVSAWYKRKTQVVILVIGAAVAVAANADTIAIVESLSRDSALREALVAQAEAYVDADRPPEQIAGDIDQLQALGIPLGWTQDRTPEGWGWLEKAIGLLLTAFALSLGAPFWFDLLKKAINIRAVGRNPLEAEGERRKG